MGELPRTLKITTIWLLLGITIFLFVSWWLRQETQSELTIGDNVIQIRQSRDKHFYWMGEINGYAVRFLIDTGATFTSIPQSIAQELNLPDGPIIEMQTANGNTLNHTTKANLCLEGNVCMTNLQMVVLPLHSDHALLGMNVIGRLKWSQQNGIMRIERPPT